VIAVNPRRRSFLKLGLLGAVALAAGGSLRWFTYGYRREPGEITLALSTKELCIVKAVIRALLPASDEFPSGESLGVAQRVDEQLWAAPRDVRSQFGAGLRLFEHAPVLHGYAGRFTSLSPDEQRAYFQDLLVGKNASLRQIAAGLKQVVHLLYYARPEVWPKIGYDGPWVPAAVLPDSRVAYLDLLSKKRPP
jgi:hypothetical protein